MPKSSNIFLKLLVLVFVVFCGVTIIKMQFEFNELKEQKNKVEQEIKGYEMKIDELQSQLDEQFNRDYIMRLATDKLNLHRQGEIIFYNNIKR